MASDTNDKQASGPHDSSCISSSSSGSRVIVVGSEAASTSNWHEAIHRTADAAANVMASAAASVFHSQLLERIHTAASQTGSIVVGQSRGKPRSGSAVADTQQEQVLGSISSGIQEAGAELQAETQHQEGSEPAASGRLAGASGHLPKASGHLEEVPGQLAGEGAHRSAGRWHQAAVNKNDLQQGLKLHAEVGSSLSKPYWNSFLSLQHHARASAIFGSAKTHGLAYCNDHTTALSSCSHQIPFCSRLSLMFHHSEFLDA